MQHLYKSKKFAETWHKHLTTYTDIPRVYLMNKVMEKAIGDLKGKIVLEAGCGDGFFIPNLLKKNPKKIIGIDISKWLLDYAKKRIKSKKVEFHQIDLTKKLNFKNNFFDIIVSYNVLQEIKDISTSIKEMARVLKKGGRLIISITHPLYHLFLSATETRNSSSLENLKRYPKVEPIHSSAIKGFEKSFVVYRKPISLYVNEIVKNGLKIIEMKDILVSKEVGKLSKKHRKRIGAPIFLLFKVEK
ncbi:class I SAM-dependent methyltransferase [Patescibacteria group bacterium]|nr:class I SAM-dependent methyltransferase [Patescibacteria group bacterium]